MAAAVLAVVMDLLQVPVRTAVQMAVLLQAVVVAEVPSNAVDDPARPGGCRGAG